MTGLLPKPVAPSRGSGTNLKAREEQGLDMDVPYPVLSHDGHWEAARNGPRVTETDREQLLAKPTSHT